MRVLSRIALVVLVSLLAVPSFADHLTAECPLTQVGQNPAITPFVQSPHGVFRSGNQVYVLRGQTLTTYTVTDLGDMQIAREDFIGALGARESNGGIAFSNGFLFLSSEAGLEVFDLRNVRPGGSAPLLVSRTSGLHYRRLAVNGNLLAGLYPATDLPCYTDNPLQVQDPCFNQIDIYNIASLTSPTRISSISTRDSTLFVGFNDIAWNFGFLIATGVGGTFAFNMSNPASPATVAFVGDPGTFLVSNGGNLIGVGDPGAITVYSFTSTGSLNTFANYNIPPYLTIDRLNPIVFHPQAWFDDPNGRLVTLIDELNPLTLQPARSIAFDVFDFTVPMFEGSAPRIYEALTMLNADEIKYNPVSVGSLVYVVGDRSGLQTWGACNQITGQIEWDGPQALFCGGTEIHGWVTGTDKITAVELFLDGASLGPASLAGPPRIDISSRTPVATWRVAVNLDTTPRGDHLLRAVGTDAFGIRRQFASQRVFFPGPGANCTNRRRVTAR
jgi:hypothetical protein